MDADLVCPTRFQRDVEERMLPRGLHDFEVGHRLAGLVGVERTPRRVAARAADRRVDPARARARVRANQRQVPALDLTTTNRLPEPGVRALGSRCDEESGRIAVKTVDDARPLRIVAAASLEGDELRGEGVSPPSRARVHRQSGGLVDDDEMLVLEKHANGDRLRLDTFDSRGKRDLDRRAGLESMALGTRDAVDQDRALLHQPLGERARPDLGSHRERAVETRACVVLSDGEAKSCHRARRAFGATGLQGRARRRGWPPRRR